jgi:alpha-galactosidase/6-phospho-beta-glucosidase family protein
MLKITFLGAGSTVFARNLLGDCMSSDHLRDCEIALYDIDPQKARASREASNISVQASMLRILWKRLLPINPTRSAAMC